MYLDGHFWHFNTVYSTLKTLLYFAFPITLALSFSCTTVPTDIAPGAREVQIGHDNRIRTVNFHIPKRLKRKNRSLVLVLHAGEGSAKNIAGITKREFNKISDQDNFIVGYPEALNEYWNDGRMDSISLSHYEDIDDVGFLEKTIDFAIDSFKVDPQYIFVAGYSNGGLMSLRLACELPGRVKGFAAVAASLALDQLVDCAMDTSSSLLLINGTEDPIMPFGGGQVISNGQSQGSVLSSEETINFWLKENNCTPKTTTRDVPNTDTFDETRSEKITYSGCKQGNKAVLITINNGGHTWPGGRQHLSEKEIGKTARDFDASEEIWRFFKNL
jgi:polyhydroxybutyrate depolymerase